MRPFEQRAQTIIRRLPSHALAAEIGVLRGQVSECVLQKTDASLIMVDSWLPSDQQPERYKATKDQHAFDAAEIVSKHKREALARVHRFHGRAQIKEMSSVEAASQIEDQTLDLVFIDADHSYEGVREDIEAWFPKVKSGGWIGGHDYQNPDARFCFGVDRAVDEWIEETGRTLETDLNFTWWARV